MDTVKINAIRDDFLTWSGGFPPDSEQQIFIYMEYVYGDDAEDADEVREMLRNWMTCDDYPPPKP
jgi:hypothetical protein